mgnify:CR=1 FL=1
MGLKKLLKFFFYGGIDRKIYKLYHRDIADEMTLILRPLCAFVAVAFLFFGIYGCIRGESVGVVLNIIVCLLAIIMFLFTKILPDVSSHLSNVCTYVSMMFILFYAIVSGCIFNKPHQPVVTFMVLIVSIPILMVDVPWHIMLMNGIAVLGFIITDYFTKDANAHYIDTRNAIVFYLLSCFVLPFLVHSKIEGIVNKHQLEKDRDIDNLTGLFHRNAASKLVMNNLLEKPFQVAAMYMIDVDNFKHINDTYGHAVGDKAISDVAECIKKIASEKMVAARYGGDEFILFISNLQNKQEAEMYADKLISLVASSDINKMPEMKENPITLSIGIALYPQDSKSYDKLLVKSDRALYKAKNQGKNRYSLY